GFNLYSYVRGNPTRFRDPMGLRPLTDCEKNALADKFSPEMLNAADLHTDLPWWLFWLLPSVRAITFGNDIYMKEFYNPAAVKSLALLGHEMVHVTQYASGDLTVPRYILASIIGLGSNRFEPPAYDLENELANDLRNRGISCGPPDPAAGLGESSSPIADGPSSSLSGRK